MISIGSSVNCGREAPSARQEDEDDRNAKDSHGGADKYVKKFANPSHTGQSHKTTTSTHRLCRLTGILCIGTHYPLQLSSSILCCVVCSGNCWITRVRDEKETTNRTYIDLDAQSGKCSHGRILLGRVTEKLSSSFVPFHGVQTVPLQVVAALQYRVVSPFNRARHDHDDVPQWLHQRCNEGGKAGKFAVMRLPGSCCVHWVHAATRTHYTEKFV